MHRTNAASRRGERLYLDFDSFFATAEQHFNPALRDRPVGVVPLDSPHTACIAVSREAKARGIKFGANIAQARQLIPEIIFVVARHDVYVRLHNRILKVIETCLPVTHVRSIDEVVCHLLPCEAREGAALSDRIKHALATNFSTVLTCSIGIAPTELLAKIGAEMNKPNGFVYLDRADLPHRLNHLELNDLPGISGGIEKRLYAAGIQSVQSLWNTAPKQARAIWGNVEGERFWNELHGFHAQRPDTVRRMFGHSRVLPVDWRRPHKVNICAQQLTFSAARRLRRAELQSSKLSLSFRGGGYTGKMRSQKNKLRWHWETQFFPANDYRTFSKALSVGLKKAECEMQFKPRSVSVVLHGLLGKDAVMGDLFQIQPSAAQQISFDRRREQWAHVSDILDNLCKQHGPEIISLGPRLQMPGGYVGAKIAFGRIPEQSDFQQAPVPDTQTHFCKTI